MCDKKCPLQNPEDCEHLKLFHFAINKAQVENGTLVMKVKDLKDRLKTIEKELDAIVHEMSKAARESEDAL